MFWKNYCVSDPKISIDIEMGIGDEEFTISVWSRQYTCSEEQLGYGHFHSIEDATRWMLDEKFIKGKNEN